MNRKYIITLLLFVSLVSFGQDKPNVLFFLVDDLGWNDIGTNGSKLYETPNIDALANEAIYFSNAYSAYPRCVPSRHAMISGRHPARKGRTKEGATSLEIVTIAEAMKTHGYGTYFAGKWHLGHTEETWPHNQGFDVNKGGCDAGAPASYFFPFHDETKTKNNIPYYGLEKGVKGEYITDRLTDETINYIEENNPNKTGKPFLAYLAHYAVHTPLQAKPERIKYYEDKIKELSFEGEPYVFGEDGRAKMWQDNAIYAAMVESMDESLGRIVSKLKELKIYDNTIIIFTSDHGGLSNSGLKNKRELATTNKPLRAGKGHNYEGGLKVPVFVRWPGVVRKKAETKSIITGMDYYPTILEMCGLPLQPENHLDGVSFVPALKGEKMNNHRQFFWHQTTARPTSTGDHNSSVIRQGNYKLHHFLDDDRIELYDLKKDPNEKNNIAKELPEVTEKLEKKLNRWKKEVGVTSIKKKKSTQKKPSESIMKNGNFEQGTKGWTAKGRQGANAKLMLINDAAEGKNAALVIVSKSEGKQSSAMLVSSNFTIDATETFEISFVAKTDSEKKNIKLQVQFLDKDGDSYFRAQNFEIGSVYKTYKSSVILKKDFDIKSMNVRFHIGEKNGEYFFDNIKMK